FASGKLPCSTRVDRMLHVLIEGWQDRAHPSPRTVRYRPIAQERSLAERLGPDGRRVKGTVSAWTRHPGGSDVTTAVRLRVRFPLHGTTHEVELVTSIDRELLSGFTPGSTIHLLVDPEAPDQ